MHTDSVSDVLSAAARRFAAFASRRAALAILLGGALIGSSEGEAARERKRFGTRKQKRDAGKGKKRRKEKKNKHRKDKKDKGSTAKGCKVKHSEDEILGFIRKAAKKYGQSYNAMERVARCESTLNPCAYSKSGPYYGLYQFLKSTWKTTPYGDEDLYDPKSQALAAGWMWKQGRKNEWACQ